MTRLSHCYILNPTINICYRTDEGSFSLMSIYREGYDYYVAKCMDFGLEPINFYYYVLQLSQEQLDAFNEQAKKMKGNA